MILYNQSAIIVFAHSLYHNLLHRSNSHTRSHRLEPRVFPGPSIRKFYVINFMFLISLVRLL